MLKKNQLPRYPLIIVIAGMILIGMTNNWAIAERKAPLPRTNAAQYYTVVDTQDFSAGYGRTRKSLCIASEAETFTARAHTAIRAALDFKRDTGADYIQVAITPIADIGCNDYFTAIAGYSSDGQGITGNEENHFWEVKASDVVLDIEERLVLKAWQEAKDDFEVNGDIDIEGMKQYLSRQLNLSPEKVEDYWLKSVEMGLSMRPYPLQGIRQ